MGRIRTIKPEFFLHEGLYDLEESTGLPIRLAFAGLLTQCDREGRFKWRPRSIKAAVLPFDAVDFGLVLDSLASAGFVEKYEHEGDFFGWVPTFLGHQRINQREAASELPSPDECGKVTTHVHARARTCTHVHARGEGKGKEGKGKERKERTACESDDSLLALVDIWNGLGRGIAKSGACRDPIAVSVRKGWARIRGDPEVAAAFEDLAALESAIRRATWCHRKPWFRLSWLFGKNQSGEWNAVKIVTGGFEDERNERNDPRGTAEALARFAARHAPDFVGGGDSGGGVWAEDNRGDAGGLPDWS